MALRSMKVTIRNRSDVQFVIASEGTSLVYGSWVAGHAPAAGDLLLETMDLVFQSEGDLVPPTGTEGSIRLTTLVADVPLEFYWNNPLLGSNNYLIRHVPPGLDASYEGGGGDHAEVIVTIAASQSLATAFRPSTHGWHFSNSNWAARPTAVIPGLNIPIGDASNGMCGGMVYAANDYLVQGWAIPAMMTNPLGDRYFDYIASRLWDSFHIPDGVQKYMRYMSTICPASERATVTIKDALPRIRVDIARGVPAAIGLIGTISDSPLDLGRNHQVSAYSYYRSGQYVTLGIYDPNLNDNDGLSITIDAENLSLLNLSHNLVGSMGTVYMYFHTGYVSALPPA